MNIELNDSTVWAQLPDPPFTGRPWVGRRGPDGEVILPETTREELLLDLVESTRVRHQILVDDLQVLVDDCEAGHLVASEMVTERLEKLIGTGPAPGSVDSMVAGIKHMTDPTFEKRFIALENRIKEMISRYMRGERVPTNPRTIYQQLAELVGVELK